MNRFGTTALCTSLSFLAVTAIGNRHAMAQGTTYTVCPSGCNYTGIYGAVAAANALGASAEPIDIQILPSGAGTVITNIKPTNDMTIEYTGTINLTNPDFIIAPSSGTAITTGNNSNAIGHPIITLKNFGVSGKNIPGSGVTCIQPQGGVLTMINMSVLGDFNCNDGVEGNDWRLQTGTWDIESSYFLDDGGNSGPGHALYCGFGTCIFNNDTIYNTVDGFGIKSRGTYTSITNCLISSDPPSGTPVNPAGASAAIEIAQGGSVIISGNTLIFGLGTIDTATPPTLIQLNGRQGYGAGGVKDNISVTNNTFINSEPSVAGVAINNLWQSSVLVQGNTIDRTLKPLLGAGTLTANVDNNGTAIPNATQDILAGTSVAADFRGQSGTQTVNMSLPDQVAFGGNGLLTAIVGSATGAVADTVIGAPGGINATITNTATNGMVWTSPGSSNTITWENAPHGQGDYVGYGNDTFDLFTIPGTIFDAFNVEAGADVTLNFMNDITATTTMVAFISGTATVNGKFTSFGNLNVYPGSVTHLFGTYHAINGAGVNPSLLDGDFRQSDSAATEVKFSISGGAFDLNNKPPNMQITTYDYGTLGPMTTATLDLGNAWTIEACGGGNFYYSGATGVATIGCGKIGPTNFFLGAGSGSASVSSSVTTWQLNGPGTFSATGANTGGAGTYEITPGGTGKFTDLRTFRPAVDSVLMTNGMSLASSSVVSGNRVLVFSNGGTLQFNGFSGTITPGTLTVGANDIFVTVPSGLTIDSNMSAALGTGWNISDAWAVANAGTDTVDLSINVGTIAPASSVGLPAAVNSALAGGSITAPATGGVSAIATLTATNSGGGTTVSTVPVTYAWNPAVWNDVSLTVAGAQTVVSGNSVSLASTLADPASTINGLNDQLTVVSANNGTIDTISGSPATLQSVLNGIHVRETLVGTDTITVEVIGQGGFSATGTIPVTVLSAGSNANVRWMIQ